MSGLETAIRNALDRSDRGDAQARARIYQSARQALDAGLRRQGVSDALIIMQQQKRLEDKIAEIETEERERADAERRGQVAAEAVLPAEAAAVGPASRTPVGPAASDEDFLVEGAMREADLDARARRQPGRAGAAPFAAPPVAAPALSAANAAMGARRPEPAASQPVPSAHSQPALAVDPRSDDRSYESPTLDAADGLTARLEQARPQPSRRARKVKASQEATVPRSRRRKRRSFLSRLLTWLVTLALVGAACWWFYTSGMVQSVMQDAIQAADRAAHGQAGGGSFDPRGGFSDDWAVVFAPADVAKLKVGASATAQAVAGSEGPAVRLASASPGEAGDVVVEVPVDLLRQMASKTSTIALTVQSGANQAAQLSVRCDFGSLGECQRHRFTATQEKLEALFSVTFDRKLSPNAPGRLILNAGIEGGEKSVLLYSVRILPGH